MTYGGYGGGYGAEERPEDIVTAMRDRAQQAADVRAQLADITGEATSEDGYVTAVVGVRGLQDLRLEPRAMRLASEDLAASVVATAQAASDDFADRQRAKADELGASRRPTLEESTAALERLNGMLQGGHRDVRDVFERFRGEVTGER